MELNTPRRATIPRVPTARGINLDLLSHIINCSGGEFGLVRAEP
jgi:hypothetical protein